MTADIKVAIHEDNFAVMPVKIIFTVLRPEKF
jgi:hypothetical protein